MLPRLRQTLRKRGSEPADPPHAALQRPAIEKDVGLWIVRPGAIMFGVFGGIALLLAVVGVYAVKAYAVARRTREIGIRMALGAHPRDVSRVDHETGRAADRVCGRDWIVARARGGAGARTDAYQVSPADPIALVVSSTLLALAALLACLPAARRATRVEPDDALRTE